MPSTSFLLAICMLALSVSGAWAQHTYSKAVQRACTNDYKRHCGQYGIETEALRLCMERARTRLAELNDLLTEAGTAAVVKPDAL
jgi:hypothetical protein